MDIFHHIRLDSGYLSIFLIVAENAAKLLAGGSAMIASWVLSKKYGKVAKGRGKIIRDGSFVTGAQEKQKSKIVRFLQNQEKINHIDTAVNKFLSENKPFLRQKYSLKALSIDVNVPLHYLSAFINHHHKMHFNDFINSYRVAHSREMILNGECEFKTLEAISFESGFSNRNTFTSAFKKETGQSPSEFLRQMKKSA
jgi:YesN/AraC family two-component response regulator